MLAFMKYSMLILINLSVNNPEFSYTLTCIVTLVKKYIFTGQGQLPRNLVHLSCTFLHRYLNQFFTITFPFIVLKCSLSGQAKFTIPMLVNSHISSLSSPGFTRI